MPYNKIEVHGFNFDSRVKLFQRVCPKESKKVMEHLKQLGNGEITGRVVSEQRQRKLLDMFTLFFKNYKKDLSKVTYADLKKFKEDFLNDVILKVNGEPYSDKTKEDCVESIRRYIEVEYSEAVPKLKSKTLPFRKWFVIRAKKRTPETLSEEEVEKLYESSKTIEGKFLIAVLFGAGCRIEEFLNLRFEDIEKPTQNNPYYRFDFKEEYSKTEGRKIGLYWKHCNEIISKYLSICEDKEPKNQIFPKEYDAVRMFLGRLGKKALGKRVNPHLFRKSSATFYADKLNRQQLCIRFGWKFSSDMPDVYISRAGVDEEKIKDVMLNTDLSKMEKENQELKTKQDILEKDFEKMKNLLGKVLKKGNETLGFVENKIKN